jgi:Zn finger protein HypA/HybF involved in hydrogenase expression
MFKQSVLIVLLTLSLSGLVGCGSKVADKPVTTPGGAMSTTTKPGALAIVPSGTTINTDLQQELSSGKNTNNQKFTIKVKNASVGKYPVLKDAILQGHLEQVNKAAKGKKASINLVFDAVKLKNGDLMELDAQLVNTQVETKTKGTFIKNAGIILGGTIAGNFIGDKTKFKHGKLAGAAVATAFVLSSPGGEVVLAKGTDLQLKLKSNFDPN